MSEYSAFIPLPLPDLNNYTKTSRSPKAGAIMANKVKQDTEQMICLCLPATHPDWSYPLRVLFCWHVPNKRKDLDNLAFGQKFVLDALQKKGIIENDGMNYIGALHHGFTVDPKNIGVEILIEEMEKGE